MRKIEDFIIDASFIKEVWSVRIKNDVCCIEMDEIKELEKKFGTFDSIHFNSWNIELYFYTNKNK